MATKIAIIEDDQAIREMYELKLKKSGYTVKTAKDGAEGLKLLQEFIPDLVLLDLMMPEMSGDLVLKKWRKTVPGSSAKVIILTNISKDEAPKELEDLGVIDYIVKANHTPSQVIDIVDVALAK